MRKLVKGLIDFRKNVQPNYYRTFAKLALGQSPDTLFIACSDSRVAPNVFASTDPGDLFVVRNVGNLVPACQGPRGLSGADESEAAAVEFAVQTLGVTDVIICGHSECGAMQALLEGRENIEVPNLRAWLRHGEKALGLLKNGGGSCAGLATHNCLSQVNVLQQVENLKSYPIVQERLRENRLRIHAWWFELAKATVHCFDAAAGAFVVIDEKKAQEILRALS